MDHCPQLIRMLPSRCLTRYATTSTEKLTQVLCSFHILGNERGLFQSDPQQWNLIWSPERLHCFTECVLPLLRIPIYTIDGLSNWEAQWIVNAVAVNDPQELSPVLMVHLQERVKRCSIHDDPYHVYNRRVEKFHINLRVHDAIRKLMSLFGRWGICLRTQITFNHGYPYVLHECGI